MHSAVVRSCLVCYSQYRLIFIWENGIKNLYLEPTGLKINELSELLGVHRNTISALVNNNRKLSID